MMIGADIIPIIARAQKRIVSLFHYGTIYYEDVLAKRERLHFASNTSKITPTILSLTVQNTIHQNREDRTPKAIRTRTARHSRIPVRIFRAISGLAGMFIYREVLQNTENSLYFPS